MVFFVLFARIKQNKITSAFRTVTTKYRIRKHTGDTHFIFRDNDFFYQCICNLISSIFMDGGKKAGKRCLILLCFLFIDFCSLISVIVRGTFSYIYCGCMGFFYLLCMDVFWNSRGVISMDEDRISRTNDWCGKTDISMDNYSIYTWKGMVTDDGNCKSQNSLKYSIGNYSNHIYFLFKAL